MKKLSFIISQFVQEKQKLLQYQLEYKREILPLDATDHQLLQKFYHVEPNKTHVRRSFLLNCLYVYSSTLILGHHRTTHMGRN